MTLAWVLAIYSSYKNQPIDEKIICFGEVGLSGEVRAVSMVEQRILEAGKMGFEICILPAVSMKGLSKNGGDPACRSGDDQRRS